MMPVWIYSGSIGAYLMVMLQKNIVLLYNFSSLISKCA